MGTATQLDLRVIPGAKRDGLAGTLGGAIKVRVAAPAVGGAANLRLIRFLARTVFGVPRSTVRILRGARGRDKTVCVDRPLAEVRDSLARAGLQV